MSRLDWIEQNGKIIWRQRPSVESRRGAKRVSVGLSVAIGTKGRAYITRSIDISETGLLVALDEKSTLEVGNKVRILIKGILSDNGSGEQLLSAKVTRVNDRQVALRL